MAPQGTTPISKGPQENDGKFGGHSNFCVGHRKFFFFFFFFCTTTIIECVSLLNDSFPFMSVLNAVLPITYPHDIQVIFTSFSHLFLGFSNDLVAMGFHSYTFFTILSSGILYT